MFASVVIGGAITSCAVASGAGQMLGERTIAMWWSMALSSVVALPLLRLQPVSPGAVWPYVLPSALCEVIYFVLLMAAYRSGEFSLVYPIARGATPALVALGSVLFLGERLGPFGLLGLGLIVAGLAVVGSSAWLARREQKLEWLGIALALGAAVFIAFYTVIDGAAVKHNPPAPYTELIFLAMTLGLAPLVVGRYGWREVLAQGRAHWPRLALTALLMFGAYALVLAVYSVAQVSYAGALREVSIVLAALAGWLLLGEDLGRVRVVGSLVVFAGIVLIAMLG